MSEKPTTCVNCGTPLTGPFCAQCGEKAFDAHDKTIAHFLHEAFHFITHLDGKFLRSLRLVFFKPGFLSLEYCQGVRKKYFRPVSLFLVGVILYLIFPLLQGLNMSHQMTVGTFNSMHITIVEDLSVRKAEKKNITLEELGARYDAKSPKVAKLLLLILLPLSAGLLWLLFFRKRGFMFDHLILSTELNTLFLYTTFLIIPVILSLASVVWGLISGYGFDYDDKLIVPVQLVLLSVGWGASFKRFYSTGTWEMIWKTLVFFILHSLLVYVVYRFILFLLVLQFV
jgi:Protein of unknown function (DUF3667)